MLKIGSYTFQSRLFLGTGKYENTEIQRQAVEAPETEVLTFAVRRMDLSPPESRDMFEAMKLAARSGRLGFESGRIAKKAYATASSPTEGMFL